MSDGSRERLGCAVVFGVDERPGRRRRFVEKTDQAHGRRNSGNNQCRCKEPEPLTALLHGYCLPPLRSPAYPNPKLFFCRPKSTAACRPPPRAAELGRAAAAL